MAKFCTNCGKELSPEMTVCPECGAPIPGAQPQPQTETVRPSAQQEEKPAVPTPETPKEPLTPELTLTPDISTYSQPQPPLTNAQPAAPQPQVTEQPQPAPQPAYAPQPQPAYQSNPPMQQNVYAQQNAPQMGYMPPVAGAEPVPMPMEEPLPAGAMSTAGFFWLMFLYAIPVVGFIACLIMAFASKNASRRNYSRAVLIWVLVGLIVAVFLGIVGWIFSKSLAANLSGTEINSFEDLLNQIMAAFGS